MTYFQNCIFSEHLFYKNTYGGLLLAFGANNSDLISRLFCKFVFLSFTVVLCFFGFFVVVIAVVNNGAFEFLFDFTPL